MSLVWCNRCAEEPAQVTDWCNPCLLIYGYEAQKTITGLDKNTVRYMKVPWKPNIKPYYWRSPSRPGGSR